jgi:hypothetical protein
MRTVLCNASINRNSDIVHTDTIYNYQVNEKMTSEIHALLRSIFDILYGTCFGPSLSASCDDDFDSIQESAPR